MNVDKLFQDEPQSSKPKFNKNNILIGALCAIGFAVSLPGLVQSYNSTAHNRQVLQQQNVTLARVSVEAENQKALAKIAEARYEAGCNFIRSSSNPNVPIAISSGVKVQDLVSGSNLPAGSIVCDGLGNTGVLKGADFDGDGRFNAVITDIAFTGNRKVVQEAMIRAGFQVDQNLTPAG